MTQNKQEPKVPAYIIRGSMKKETYQKIMKYFEEHPSQKSILTMGNKLCTILVFLSYPLLLFYLLIERSPQLAEAIIVPMNAFIILTVFRFLVNRPRPYEKFQTPSAIHKAKKGNSFPSRHVFSAFMIALTILAFCPLPGIGILLLIVSALIAFIRVISGVHFISDVLAGCMFAIVASLFYWL